MNSKSNFNKSDLSVKSCKTVRLTYDGVDNLLSMTDAVGQVTRYDYDKLNRRVKMTDGKGEVSTTKYDAEDNVVSMIDPVGKRPMVALV